MKRVFNILSALTLSSIVLSGCSKVEDPAFDDSSSNRVQNLIDETFATLTSSPEGWYFDFHQGWNEESEVGGHWYWFRFASDYTVEAAAEVESLIFDRSGELVESYPAGTVKSSEFQLIRGRGVVLSFNMFNPIIHFMANPSSAMPNGYEGDFEFTVVEVTPDVVTVRGIKTGKLMHFYKKTDTKPVAEALAAMKALNGASIRFFGDDFSALVKGAHVNQSTGITTVAVRTYDRVIKLTYNNLVVKTEVVEVEPGVYQTQRTPKIETTDVQFSYIPDLDNGGFTLSRPVTVMGQEISAFAYDAASKTFTSNDPGKTVVLTEIVSPLNDYFQSMLWSIDTENREGPFKTDWDAAAKYALESRYSLTLGWGLLGNTSLYSSSFANPGLAFLISQYGNPFLGHFYLNFTSVAGSDNELSIEYGGGGNGNANLIYDGFAPMFNNWKSKSPFVLTTDGTTYIKLTSKSDPSYFFTVLK